MKPQISTPTKDGNIDTRLLRPYDGPALQLPGEPNAAEDGPGLTHYQMRVSAGGSDKVRHLEVLKQILRVCCIKLSQTKPKKSTKKKTFFFYVEYSVQCYLRSDCGNTKVVLLKTTVIKLKDKKSTHDFNSLDSFCPFFMVTFIDFMCTCLLIKICILSLPAYLQYLQLKEPHFLVSSSVILSFFWTIKF